ncbi:MAG: hypothetical protein ACXAAH_17405 [Promethearchaeota archaeon]|jgi:N5-methyltetrahydromethanopterin:coenzyme M methyltransferase subunit H
MLNFETEQKIVEIGKTRIGGNPGQNPIALVGGDIDKPLVEAELNEFTEIIEDTQMQGIIDVVGAYPEALIKECEFVADAVDYPFLVDGLNDSSRIPAMDGLKEIGLLDRAILNSIDEATTEESLEKLRSIGVKNAVLLTFGSRSIFPVQKLKLLEEVLIPKAAKANIKNVLVDSAVLDLPSIGINFETSNLVKKKFGLPTGFAPANSIYGWDYIKKFGEVARCGGIASIMAYCASAPSDFILFGPIKFAKCVVPAVALISGVNSYYRKRILRKETSEKSPLKVIF